MEMLKAHPYLSPWKNSRMKTLNLPPAQGLGVLAATARTDTKNCVRLKEILAPTGQMYTTAALSWLLKMKGIH